MIRAVISIGWPGSCSGGRCSRDWPHRTLRQNPPAGRTHPPAEVTGLRVLRRDRLGGLIRKYTQVA